MVKPQLGHDQVVSEWRWSLNTGGQKSRFHCILQIKKSERDTAHVQYLKDQGKDNYNFSLFWKLQELCKPL